MFVILPEQLNFALKPQMCWMLQMKKKKTTEPQNHIQHQLLWNGKLLTFFFSFCHV